MEDVTGYNLCCAEEFILQGIATHAGLYTAGIYASSRAHLDTQRAYRVLAIVDTSIRADATTLGAILTAFHAHRNTWRGKQPNDQAPGHTRTSPPAASPHGPQTATRTWSAAQQPSTSAPPDGLNGSARPRTSSSSPAPSAPRPLALISPTAVGATCCDRTTDAYHPHTCTAKAKPTYTMPSGPATATSTHATPTTAASANCRWGHEARTSSTVPQVHTMR
jgi:hypothetical protein